MSNWLSRTIPMSKYLSGSRPLRHNEVQRYCISNSLEESEYHRVLYLLLLRSYAYDLFIYPCEVFLSNIFLFQIVQKWTLHL